ncbi:MAG TPA: DUF4270 family protein, partial [Flavobacterium sp.]|nr:DUF4270 family protein [Flavobacterium sp.]
MLDNSIIKKAAMLFAGAAFLISCDKDYNSIGSDIVGEDHFSGVRDSLFGVTAVSQKTGAVETTNLPINPLGVLNNGKFGKTIANFVTQLELATEDPKFTNVPLERVTSVILKVPYYSRFKETESDGDNIYTLDSLYGSTSNKINLSIYENGYYMRDFDPENNFQAQKFYSDQDMVFDAAKRGTDADGNSIANGGRLNNSGVSSQNSEFVFSPLEITIPAAAGGNPTKETPQMRIELDKKFFH